MSSSVLPFDIIGLVIDIIGENKDIVLLKELSLVSHFFLQSCRKHVFATVQLHDPAASPKLKRPPGASSKKGFINLLLNKPDIVKYIRKLTYNVSHHDRLLSPILPNFLQTISHLNSLVIANVVQPTKLDWMTLDSSLTSALLHLMHLPTMRHIKIMMIQNFPFDGLTPCINLNRLDIVYVDFMMMMPLLEGDDGSQEVVHLEEIPRIIRFSAAMSSLATRELLQTKRRDGRLAFNFTDVKQLSVDFSEFEDTRDLLQNFKHLEKLQMQATGRFSLAGLHDMISPSARTLKFLTFIVPLGYSNSLPLAGLYEGLESIAGHNALESLDFHILLGGLETEDNVGSRIQKLEEVLVKPGWPTLKQVSFQIFIMCCTVSRATSVKMKLSEALQSLPAKYLGHLSRLESVAFSYSAGVMKCIYD